MSFEEYLRSTLGKIAAGEEIDVKVFEERVKTYLKLLNRGMSRKAAKNVMDLYMPPIPESVYYPFPDEL